MTTKDICMRKSHILKQLNFTQKLPVLFYCRFNAQCLLTSLFVDKPRLHYVYVADADVLLVGRVTDTSD